MIASTVKAGFHPVVYWYQHCFLLGRKDFWMYRLCRSCRERGQEEKETGKEKEEKPTVIISLHTEPPAVIFPPPPAANCRHLGYKIRMKGGENGKEAPNLISALMTSAFDLLQYFFPLSCTQLERK